MGKIVLWGALGLIILGVGMIIGAYDAWSQGIPSQSFMETFQKPQVTSITSIFRQSDAQTPGDRVQEHQIKITKNYARIELPDLVLVRVAATGSMKPTFDEKTHLLELPVTNAEQQLSVGDIASFKYNGETIVHRIIDISQDANNVKRYRTKGDALTFADPGYRLGEDFERVVVGMLT